MQERFDDLFDNLPHVGSLRCIRRDLLHQPIATVMDSEQASRLYLTFMRGDIDEVTFDTQLEECIVERGMTKEAIEAAFPPEPAIPGQSDLTFNRKALIATILWQEWQRVGQRRPQGNIRHFWYTHLMYTLMRVMKDTNIKSIFNTYNGVLRDLVRKEGFRYADLNFVSTKSRLCEAIFADSPYPNIILACEKESYHGYLKHLAHVFHLTFLSLGGQGSYQVYEDLVFQFMDAGIDLDQEFRLFVISDFDPHGYKIQAAAKKHLEDAGIQRVTLERVYLSPEHLTPGIIERFAVPYEAEKKSDTATKGALTLYNKFGAETGGIYKRGGAWVHFDRNGDGTYHVPHLSTGDEGYELYRVELDNFREEVLIERLIDALERVIDGAEYYYATAARLWRETIDRGAIEAATTLITTAVREKLQPIESALREVIDRLSARWDELTAEEDTLIGHVREDAEFQVDTLQEQIDAIQAHIDALRDEQRSLEARQERYRTVEDDVIDFLHAVKRAVVPEIPAAQQQLNPIETALEAYGAAQEEAQADAVAQAFDRARMPIHDVDGLDFARYRDHIFREARAGAQTFEARLPYTDESRVRAAAEDDLEAQQAAMPVEVPDLPPVMTDDFDTRLQDAEALLARARRQDDLPAEWQSLLRLLQYHYVHGDIGWNPWDDWDTQGWS